MKWRVGGKRREAERGRQTRDGEAERVGEIKAALKEEAHPDLPVLPTFSPVDRSALQDEGHFYKPEPETVWFGSGAAVEIFTCMIAWHTVCGL